MPDKKPHVKLNTEKQADPTGKLKFNYGFGRDDENDLDEEKDYFPMTQDFSRYLNNLIAGMAARAAERNPRLNVPLHIDYIQIRFQSQFVVSEFYSQWFNEFGLTGIKFSKFNHEVLFAITDSSKFEWFVKNIENFIKKESGQDQQAQYVRKITFIKDFASFSSADMIRFTEVGPLMNVSLIDSFPLDKTVFDSIYSSLEDFLKNNDIHYRFSEISKNLEVHNATGGQIQELVRNFDIVLNVTSSLATVISPSLLNQPVRSYGFDIGNTEEDLPIIGIIDTGISSETPLSSLLIQDDRFNLTGSSPFLDNVNHGTAIAALAALGKKPYAIGYRGNIAADARLLSIKILDGSSGYLAQSEVLGLLTKVKMKYPSIKTFVLAACYDEHKRTNEDYSAYAYELDKFSHQKDCIIMICTANNNNAHNRNINYNLGYFLEEETNICIPAESLNNITVGAAAGSLRPGNFEGISTAKEFPALYSRKGHIDMPPLFPKNKINKNYFKPDVLECGGDYEYSSPNSFIGAGLKASMELLSSSPAEGFYNLVGTSYSAPLVANIAAQIQKNYPAIRAQSIKALIINAASLELIRFQKQFTKLLNKTAGHGLVDDEKSVFSNENAITFLVEDSIAPEQVKVIPLHFPKYLTLDNLGKQDGIVKVTATLCFSFEPVLNQQLAYCPVHMAFCFFKNQSADQILTTEKNLKSLLKSDLRWSQSGRHVSKPVPYTNTQKISFWVNKQDLINEGSTMKLAINCRINPQLLPGTDDPYCREHSFSIAILIEETLKKGKSTGKLYDEMILCNSIENITTIDLEAEDNEAEL